MERPLYTNCGQATHRPPTAIAEELARPVDPQPGSFSARLMYRFGAFGVRAGPAPFQSESSRVGQISLLNSYNMSVSHI